MFIALIYLLVYSTPVSLRPPTCAEICKYSTDIEVDSSKCDCSLERSESAQSEDIDDSGVYYEPAGIDTLHRLSFIQPPFIIINPGLKLKLERKAPRTIIKRKSKERSWRVSKRKTRKHTRRHNVNNSNNFTENTQSLYLDIDLDDSDNNDRERTSNAGKSIDSSTDISENIFKECVDILLKVNSIKISQIDNNNNLTDSQLIQEITKKCSQPSDVIKKSIKEIKSKWLKTHDTSLKVNSTENAHRSTKHNLEKLNTKQSHRKVINDMFKNHTVLMTENENILNPENSIITNKSNNLDTTTQDPRADEFIVTNVSSNDSTLQHSQLKKIYDEARESHEESNDKIETRYSNGSFEAQQQDYHLKEKQSTVTLNSSDYNLNNQGAKSQYSTQITTENTLKFEDSTEDPFRQIDQSDVIENSSKNLGFNTRRIQVQSNTTSHKKITNVSRKSDNSENVSMTTSDIFDKNNVMQLENEHQTTDYMFSSLKEQEITTESSFATSKYSHDDKLTNLSYSNVVTESSFQTTSDDLIEISITTGKYYQPTTNTFYSTQKEIDKSTIVEFSGRNSEESVSSTDMWDNIGENSELVENVTNKSISLQPESINYSIIKNTQTNQDENVPVNNNVQTTDYSKYELEPSTTNDYEAILYHNTKRLEPTTTNIMYENSTDVTTATVQSTEKPPRWFLITVDEDTEEYNSKKVNYYVPGNTKNKKINDVTQRVPSTLSQLTTNLQDESNKKTTKIIKRHGTLIGKNVKIPKVLTREFENDTVISEVNEGTETVDDDFSDDDVASSSTAMVQLDTETIALNTNKQISKTLRSRNEGKNTLSGKLYFKTGKYYIPARFVQEHDGQLSVGMDLMELCSKLNSGENRPRFIDEMCKIHNKILKSVKLTKL